MATELTPEVSEEEIVDGLDTPETPAGLAATPEQIAALKHTQPPIEFDDTPGLTDLTPTPNQNQQTDELPVVTDADSKISEKAANEPEGGTEGEQSAEPEFEQYLLEAAGLTAEQAKNDFGSPDALKSAVRMLDARFVAAGQQVLSQRRQVPDTQQQQSAARQQPTSDEKPAELPAFKLPKPKESDDWDEDTKALVDSIKGHFEAQLSAQQKAFNERLGQQQAATEQMLAERARAEQLSYVEEFDGFVNKLGDAWKPLLGQGSGFDLPKEGMAYQNRVHLDTIAAQLKAGLEVQGRPELDREQLLNRALQIAFPEQNKLAVKKEVTEQITSRQRMMTQRPTAKGGTPKSGQEKAEKTTVDWYKKHGFTVDEDEFSYDEV